MAMSPARLCRVSVWASGGGVRRGAVYRQPQIRRADRRRLEWWPHSGRPTALNAATYRVTLNSIAPVQRTYGQVAEVPVYLYGSDGQAAEASHLERVPQVSNDRRMWR
jgi:hypothetical protein